MVSRNLKLFRFFKINEKRTIKEQQLEIKLEYGREAAWTPSIQYLS